MGAFDNKGIIRIGTLSRIEVDTMNHYFDHRATYSGHVRRGNSDDMYVNHDSSCYSLQDIILAPFLLEIGLKFSPLAESYLGQRSYMYSMNVFNTYPSGNPPIGYIQEFHRDHDDTNFLALFIYLNDIFNSSDGAHQYITGTHKEGIEIGGIETIYGCSGTMFMENGKGLHRGIKPSTNSRRIAWIRWGISNPPRTYVQDGISPVDKTLVVDYDKFSQKEKDLIQLIVR